MSDKLEKINKLEENIRAMEEELLKYQDLFLANDGVIDKAEQNMLDDMFAVVNDAVEALFVQKGKLPPEITFAVFMAGKYKKTNYVPLTGIGLFDINLTPSDGRLEILTKVKFDFIDGNPTKFAGKKKESNIWSTSEKKKWAAEYITLIEGRWGGKYHFIHPDMIGVTVFVDVEVEEVASGWHYELNITKIPEGDFKGSDVSHFIDKSGKALAKTDKHQGNFDSEDMDWKHKGTSVKESQMGSVHEYGHMVGLDDEYSDSDPGKIAHQTLVRDALGTVLVEGNYQDVMSVGNHIEKQHYVTFLAALKDVTGLKKWQFKK